MIKIIQNIVSKTFNLKIFFFQLFFINVFIKVFNFFNNYFKKSNKLIKIIFKNILYQDSVFRLYLQLKKRTEKNPNETIL